MLYNELSRIQKAILHIKSFFYVPRKGIMVCRKCGFKSEYTDGDLFFVKNRMQSCFDNVWHLRDYDRCGWGVGPTVIRRQSSFSYRCPICREIKEKKHTYFLWRSTFDNRVDAVNVRNRN
jgi:hypothetical protein